jgi:ethanolamine permease
VLWEFLVVICAASQYPGLVDDEIKGYLPLNSGFRNAFHMDDHMATLISLPILFISNAIYIFGYGKQMKALAQSKLLPSFFGWTLPNTKIPFMSLIIGSLFGLLLMVILVKGFHFSYYSNTINDLFNAALLGSYFTFLITFISFIIFRRKFSSLSRGFRNPLGIYGAIYGIISLLFLWVSVIGFSDDRYDALIYVVCFLAICSIYYFSYAKYVQVYSEEEQNVLFVVYLIKGEFNLNLLIQFHQFDHNSFLFSQ